MSWADRVIDTRSAIVPARTREVIPDSAEQRYTLDQLSKMFSFGGTAYPFIMAAGSTSYDDVERDEHNFVDYVNSIYKSNGVIFGVVLARIQLFAEARFQFQRMRKGRPGDLYGTDELSLLEKPWPNGTTGELLARMEQDVSIGGNAYVVREAGRLRRLRPDWVQIILNEAPARAIKSDVVGYLYTPGGGTGRDEVNGKIYLPNEICHWSPIPDPEAQYRGMSWLTPVLSEIQADQATTRHKLRFFENAATPNLAVSFAETITKSQFEGFMAAMNASHQGTQNAYKTLYLGGGADVKVIGADLRQLDFKATQGAGETRICAAGGVPPIIVGLSEGLQSATYSNYGMARRKFGDHWARPQWRSVCSALERIITTPRDSRLWYDDRDIAFLREDQKDVAAIQSQQAGTMKQLLDAGYTPESVMAAVTNEDWAMLEHSGLYSVQLQPPGQAGGAPPGPGGKPPAPGGPAQVDAPAAPKKEPEQGPADNPTPVASPPGTQPETKALLDLIGSMQRQIETLTDRVMRGANWDPKDHPRGPDGKFGDKGVDDLPTAETDVEWSKQALKWTQYDHCEATRASADKLAKLEHVANPNWPQKPTAASTKRAKMMLDKLADPATGNQKVSNRSQDAVGRWGGKIVKLDPSSDWRNPKEIVIREQMPSRRITVPHDQMDAFKSSLDEPVNISLASFAQVADDYHRQMQWGGDHGQEVFLRVEGNPRVLQTDVELVTGGQFDVVRHGATEDGSYEVILRQKAVFNSSGDLVPVEG